MQIFKFEEFLQLLKAIFSSTRNFLFSATYFALPGHEFPLYDGVHQDAARPRHQPHGQVGQPGEQGLLLPVQHVLHVVRQLCQEDVVAWSGGEWITG